MRSFAGPCLVLWIGLGMLTPIARAGDFFTERVATGLDLPVFAEAAPGYPNKLYIGELQSGRILVLDLVTGQVASTPFIDVGTPVTGGEQGLVGMAFHPDHASNRQFFVNLSVVSGLPTGDYTEVRRYTRSLADPNVADPGFEIVIHWVQPASTNVGGWLGFGSDDYLYIGVGDGGGIDDSGTGHTPGTGNAQDITNNRLGKILRIDVDGDAFPADTTANYAIPPGNPFAAGIGDDEIWAWGLRNPFRACFDRSTGDLYIGDVGRNTREEVDVIPAGTPGPNFEWRYREGTVQTPGAVGAERPPGGIQPIYEYAHGAGAFQGNAIIGGCIYRGPAPSLQGLYIFGDYIQERVWALRWDGSAPASFNGANYDDLEDLLARPELVPDAGTIESIVSFGEDLAGNLYIVTQGGDVFRLSAVAPVPIGRAPLVWLFALAIGALAWRAARRLAA